MQLYHADVVSDRAPNEEFRRLPGNFRRANDESPSVPPGGCLEALQGQAKGVRRQGGEEFVGQEDKFDWEGGPPCERLPFWLALSRR